MILCSLLRSGQTVIHGISTGASTVVATKPGSAVSACMTPGTRARHSWRRLTYTPASRWRFFGTLRSPSRWRSTPKCPTKLRGQHSNGSEISRPAETWECGSPEVTPDLACLEFIGLAHRRPSGRPGYGERGRGNVLARGT